MVLNNKYVVSVLTNTVQDLDTQESYQSLLALATFVKKKPALDQVENYLVFTYSPKGVL